MKRLYLYIGWIIPIALGYTTSYLGWWAGQTWKYYHHRAFWIYPSQVLLMVLLGMSLVIYADTIIKETKR